MLAPLTATMPRYAYRIASGGSSIDLGNSMSVDGRTIDWTGEFDSIEFIDVHGRLAGLLVGYAFDPRADMFLPSGRHLLPAEITDADGLERLLDSFSGAFFCLTSDAYGGRIYMDPGGHLPLFWLEDCGSAASSPVELASAGKRAAMFDRELHDVCIAHEGAGSWIGGDLTAFTGMRKLLPGHYLDLRGRRPVRYWPRPGTSWMSFETAVEQASAAMLSFMTAAANRFDLRVCLTAGNDTRLMLAACRDVTDRVEFFTLGAEGAEMDLWAARNMCITLGLAHRTIPPVHSEPEDEALWDERVGYSIIESNRRQFRSLAALGHNAVVASGMYGEVGRCRLYRQNVDSINGMNMTPRFVNDRLTIPMPPAVEASTKAWLASLEGQPSSVIMDMAFTELKFGSWAMGQHGAQNQMAFHISPMGQRAVLEAFTFVRPEEKRTERLFHAIIAACWPRVLEFPINRYGDWRDQLSLARKAMNPNRVRRFVRDRLARA